jgi:DNA-binding NtrC family response regulator
MSESVLIIEDDAALLRGLKDNFEFKGYQVRTAADGHAGLKGRRNGSGRHGGQRGNERQNSRFDVH